MKIYVLKANENWICDRFAEEWSFFNPTLGEDNIHEADILWIMAPWQWDKIPVQLLKSKKVVTTIHHIVPDKFTRDSLRDFLERDKYVDCYHVTCQQTKDILNRITKKPIYRNPFWVNQDLWFDINKQQVRQKYNISDSAYIIGSFQRDTEGHDLVSPKLEKGPDRFCDIVEHMYKNNSNLQVILAGWRRQYVIKRLDSAGIKYHYFQLPDLSVINELYNCLDLYIVAARYEGGPQSIVECAASNTPIISTNVGIASNILSKESIYDSVESLGIPNTVEAHENVRKYMIPHGFDEFINIFEDIYNS